MQKTNAYELKFTKISGGARL